MRLTVPGCVNDPRAMPYFRLLVVTTAMAVYLAMGASVFQATEGPLERETEERIAKVTMDFLNNHPCVSGKLPAHRHLL
ncbi:unnamed protein product, partial [Iphiclides podalirius]